jgi:type IV pilus assembly protein PilN
MATINLLPWRDEYRQEKRREFFSTLILLVALSGLMGYMYASYVGTQLDQQRSRNAIFTKEIGLLDEKIRQITALKSQRKELESRIELIQGLQNKRPLIVHYFDRLVRAIPEGIHFKRVSRDGNIYTIIGVAESNKRVSTLMRNLDESPFFGSPNLINVVEESFELTVESVTPPEFSNLIN